jgi:signal transduction histidine kinase
MALHRTFFSRYQKIISLVYGAITLSALFLFSFLYHDNHDAIIKSLNLRLLEQRQAFNGVLKVRYDAVKAMQRQARNFLNRSYNPLWSSLNLQPLPGQDAYYLVLNKKEQETQASLIGEGPIPKDGGDLWQELQMAYSLNPLISVLKNNVKSITCLHYTSKRRFVIEFPFRPNALQAFDDTIYTMEYYVRSLPHHNKEDKVFWTDVYLNHYGKGIMVTCAAPVYKGSEYRGVVGADMMLDSIASFVDNIYYDYGEFVIINDRDHVVADLTVRENECCEVVKLQSLIPEDFPPLDMHALKDSSLTRVGKYWIFVSETSYAPWRVLYYCRSMDVALETLRNIMPSLILGIIFTTLFLIGADRLISREFIEPASRLVDHISTMGKGDPRTLDGIREPWKTWFDAVSQVFSENRALVAKLEKDIDLLDDIVAQRTRDLSKKNKLLEKTLEDLQKAQSQIVTQEKLAGLGALTAGIAHEIRNPLNFIVNFSETSKFFMHELLGHLTDCIQKSNKDRRLEIDELVKNLEINMSKIEEHGRRADSIVQGMLSHARGGDEASFEADINETIRENIILAQAAFKQNGFTPELVIDLADNLPPIHLFKRDFGRVILNMLNNAAYALFEKHQSLLAPDFEPVVKLTSCLGEKGVEIIIEDNGPGIPKLARKKIFDPFFTTKPVGKGTGLGLSLSYDIIVNQHHGELILDTKAGEYTKFTIVLPIEPQVLSA